MKKNINNTYFNLRFSGKKLFKIQPFWSIRSCSERAVSDIYVSSFEIKDKFWT